MSETSGAGPEMDALREETRAMMNTRKASVQVAATQIGIGYSTLDAFLRGTYKGDNQRVAGEIRKWLATTAAAAESHAIAPAWAFVPTPTAQGFLAALQHAQVRADLVTVSGGAGVGKTEAAKEYARTHPNVWIVTAKPSVSRPHPLLYMIAAAIGVLGAAPSQRNAAIVHRLSGTRGLLIVDEANHLTTASLDEVRSLHDGAVVGVALMGNEEVYSRLDGGGRRAEFAQLFSRIGMRVRRSRPIAGDIEALADAAGIEGSAERKLLRVIAGKPGALRGAVKCMTMAQMLAAQEATAVTAAHISQAWSRLSDNAPLGDAA